MVCCVAHGCSNGQNSGASFHRFPKEKKRLSNWLKRMNRSNWKPTARSLLCSVHFNDDCFVISPNLIHSLGIKCGRMQLKRDAIPTIFDKKVVEKKNKSLAYQKRRNLELMKEVTAGKQKNVETVENVLPLFAETVENIENSFISINVEIEMFADKSFQTCPLVQHRGTQCSRQINKWSRGVQVGCSTTSVSIGIQCQIEDDLNCENEFTNGIENLKEMDDYEEMDDFEEMDNLEELITNKSDDDPDFEPDVFEDADYEIKEELQDSYLVGTEPKFIVYASALRSLLDVCRQCLEKCVVTVTKKNGSLVMLKQICTCGHTWSWSSQPMHHQMPLGDLELAAGIFFSGSSPVKALSMFKSLNVCCMSQRTYSRMQSHYLLPATYNVWRREQENLLKDLHTRELALGTDGRCDSPGHSAKYMQYTLMDLGRNKVIGLQQIQCNEVTSSNAMELEALKRSLNFFDERGIKVCSITTDRHVGIKKYLREQRSDIRHQFDVFHMAKGVKKKILAASKTKRFAALKNWAKPASNHLYWCAMTSNGDPDRTIEKWKSFLNHITNKHTGHGKKFRKCDHGEIEAREWLEHGSREHKKLEEIVCSKLLLSDIPKLSPDYQTSEVESFHCIICFFAPKSQHFFYHAMMCRCLLAALHYNENANRPQATTKNGDRRWSLTIPKYKKDGSIVKEVKVKSTFDYVGHLMQEVHTLRQKFPSYTKATVLIEELPEAPRPLTPHYSQEQKQNAIVNHKTRFNK